MDQPGKVANPARGQLNSKDIFFPNPLAPAKLVSRDGFGCPFPRQPAHCPHSGGIWCLITGFLPLSATASIYLFIPSWVQSRVDMVTQLRTNGVHCQTSTGTGHVILRVVPVTGAAFSGITMDQFLRSSLFPHPCLVQRTCAMQKVLGAIDY